MPACMLNVGGASYEQFPVERRPVGVVDGPAASDAVWDGNSPPVDRRRQRLSTCTHLQPASDDCQRHAQHRYSSLSLPAIANGQIPLDGPDRTGPDPTRPTDKIRTCRDWTDISTTRQSPRTCRRPERTRPDFVGDQVPLSTANHIQPGRRPGSPTKSGRARLVEFVLNVSCPSVTSAFVFA